MLQNSSAGILKKSKLLRVHFFCRRANSQAMTCVFVIELLKNSRLLEPRFAPLGLCYVSSGSFFLAKTDTLKRIQNGHNSIVGPLVSVPSPAAIWVALLAGRPSSCRRLAGYSTRSQAARRSSPPFWGSPEKPGRCWTTCLWSPS